MIEFIIYLCIFMFFFPETINGYFLQFNLQLDQVLKKYSFAIRTHIQ